MWQSHGADWYGFMSIRRFVVFKTVPYLSQWHVFSVFCHKEISAVVVSLIQKESSNVQLQPLLKCWRSHVIVSALLQEESFPFLLNSTQIPLFSPSSSLGLEIEDYTHTGLVDCARNSPGNSGKHRGLQYILFMALDNLRGHKYLRFLHIKVAVKLHSNVKRASMIFTAQMAHDK